MFIPTKTVELINKISSGGVQVSYRYTRSPHLFSPLMASIEIIIENAGKLPLKNFRIGQKVKKSINIFFCNHSHFRQ